MGFLSSDKSVEDMVEEEEMLEQKSRVEQRKNSIEELKLLRELKKREGKQAKMMYRDSSRPGGYDWNAMKMRASVPNSRSIVAVPKTRTDTGEELSKLGGR